MFCIIIVLIVLSLLNIPSKIAFSISPFVRVYDEEISSFHDVFEYGSPVHAVFDGVQTLVRRQVAEEQSVASRSRDVLSKFRLRGFHLVILRVSQTEI